MKDLLQRLRQRAWRMTPQRRVVAEALAGEHVHLTADEVYARAVAGLPEISRATVYNTLKDLTDLGEVLQVTIDARATRYDPNATDPHQHLVCEECGLIRDVHYPPDGGLTLPARERHGFILTGVDVVFRGRCPACRAKPEAKSKLRRKSPPKSS